MLTFEDVSLQDLPLNVTHALLAEVAHIIAPVASAVAPFVRARPGLEESAEFRSGALGERIFSPAGGVSLRLSMSAQGVVVNVSRSVNGAPSRSATLLATGALLASGFAGVVVTAPVPGRVLRRERSPQWQRRCGLCAGRGG